MVNILELRAEMARKGYNQIKLAREIGIVRQTLARKIRNERFTTGEVEKIVQVLRITDPTRIFFAQGVTWEVTDKR